MLHHYSETGCWFPLFSMRNPFLLCAKLSCATPQASVIATRDPKYCKCIHSTLWYFLRLFFNYLLLLLLTVEHHDGAQWWREIASIHNWCGSEDRTNGEEGKLLWYRDRLDRWHRVSHPREEPPPSCIPDPKGRLVTILPWQGCHYSPAQKKQSYSPVQKTLSLSFYCQTLFHGHNH